MIRSMCLRRIVRGGGGGAGAPSSSSSGGVGVVPFPLYGRKDGQMLRRQSPAAVGPSLCRHSVSISNFSRVTVDKSRRCKESTLGSGGVLWRTNNSSCVSQMSFSSGIRWNSGTPSALGMFHHHGVLFSSLPSNLASRRQFSSKLFPPRETTSCSTKDSNNENNAENGIESSQSTFYDAGGNMADSSSLSNIVESSAAEAAEPLVFTPTWYNPVDGIVQFLSSMDSLHDLPYAYTIIGTTVFVRFLVFPLFVVAQRNSSRMAYMQPEMDQLRAKIEHWQKQKEQSKMNALDHQQRLQQQMQALFRRYDCNPLKSLMAPAVQMPLFVSLFFALRKMPDYAEFAGPLLSAGGVLWFPDLTQPDPYYVLPVLSALTFLGTMELTKDTMRRTASVSGGPNPNTMLNVFRGLAVVMVPLSAYFPASVLCYWVTNNTISMGQTVLMQQPLVQGLLGIWPPPPSSTTTTPSTKKEVGIFDKLTQMIRPNQNNNELPSEELIKQNNQQVENRKLELMARGGGRKGRKGKKRRM